MFIWYNFTNYPRELEAQTNSYAKREGSEISAAIEAVPWISNPLPQQHTCLATPPRPAYFFLPWPLLELRVSTFLPRTVPAMAS